MNQMSWEKPSSHLFFLEKILESKSEAKYLKKKKVILKNLKLTNLKSTKNIEYLWVKKYA